MASIYIFAGNRFFVLEEMLRLNLQVKKIYAVSGSYLEKELIKKNIDHNVVNNKQQLIQEIKSEKFDIFVSNGCPYILPITELTNGQKLFINIHPSYLPELRGADPQPGALLYARDSGATCHIMDDGIDTGEIIAQIKIPYSKDLDAALLYQLTFLAERDVFIQAHKTKFKVTKGQVATGKELYYSKNTLDLKIDFSMDANAIYQNIKAFSNRSQGANFIHCNTVYKVFDCEYVENEYLLSKINNYKDNEVVFNYENMLLIKKEENYLKLKCFDKDIQAIFVGAILGQ